MDLCTISYTHVCHLYASYFTVLHCQSQQLHVFNLTAINLNQGFPHISVGKESTCNAEDPSLILGSGRYTGEKQATHSRILGGFLGGSAGKECAGYVEDLGWIPGLKRSPGEEKGYPLQYTCLENSMDSIVQGSQELDITYLLTSRSSHISSSQWLHVTNVYCIGDHACKGVSSPLKVLPDSSSTVLQFSYRASTSPLKMFLVVYVFQSSSSVFRSISLHFHFIPMPQVNFV